MTPTQKFLLETVGIDPDDAVLARPVLRSQADRWETNLAAARQYHAREGHLRVPRKHVEAIRAGEDGEGGEGGEGGQETVVKLSTWIDNTRRRATKVSPERRTHLDELGMRW